MRKVIQVKRKGNREDREALGIAKQSNSQIELMILLKNLL